MFPTLEVPDCQIISKAFERGCSYSLTEESVFATLTPVLLPMRTLSATVVAQTDNLESLYIRTSNLSSNTNDDNTVNVDPNKDVNVAVNAISKFYKDCLECEIRIPSLEDMFMKVLDSLAATFERIGLHFWKQLQQLEKILSFWNQPELDFCQLIEFLKFQCVPDLKRMISALVSLIMNLAQDMTSIMDILLSLVSPLVTPFLSSIIGAINQYIQAVIKPLECVIRRIQDYLTKADWSPLFNSGNIKGQFGPKRGQKGGTGVWGKYTDMEGNEQLAGQYERPDGWGIGFDVNLKEELRFPEKVRLERAEKKLAEIRKQGGNIDANDVAQAKAYRDSLEQTVQEREEAADEYNLTEIQQAQKSVSTFEAGMKSYLYKMQTYLNKAIKNIEAFFQNIVSEFTKLMQACLGGSNQSINANFQKLEIIRLIKIIVAIIKFITKGFKCDDKEAKIEDWLGFIPQDTDKNYLVYVDKQDNIHIEENNEKVVKSVEKTIQVLGDSNFSPSNTEQGIKSMLMLTGDDVIDSEVASLVNVATTPSHRIFKCSLQTSNTNIDKVNQWIRELNSV